MRPQPRSLAIAALVLGILTLVGLWIPFRGGLLGLVAIILGIVVLVSRRQGGHGLAWGGIIAGILGLLGNALLTLGLLALVPLGV